MTRGRKLADIEQARELVEADLAALGNARVYLRLVVERLQVLGQRGLSSLAAPGVEDLEQADRLIRTVQGRIGRRASQALACPLARALDEEKQ